MNPADLLFHVRNPQVLTGREINACRKTKAESTVRICLVFPDTYEIGMSHGGLKILYHLLNNLAGVSAERCFLPEPDSVPVYRQNRVPLFSLEQRTVLADFDLIGFSLLSELNFTNVLLALQLAGMPLRSRDRTAAWPIVAAGGMAVANPEPLREFIDLFALGDGEVIFPDVVRILQEGKNQRWAKNRLLEELARLDGIYVPAFHQLRQEGDFFVPASGTLLLRKRVLPSLEDYRDETAEIVPIGNVVFNRLNVEIARGCPHSCRFCQARSFYAPFRPKKPGTALSTIRQALRCTGFEAFSLSSLSSGDYPQLAELLGCLRSLVRPEISFSVPSLRPATLSEEILAAIALSRRTGITIVPEAGSLRLRRMISKNVSDEEIRQAVFLALRHGWQKIKMYFMIGLPGETHEDLQCIVDLMTALLDEVRHRQGRLTFHLSFSTFVPKPHTPLQWAQRENLACLQEKIAFLRQHLKRFRRIVLDFHSPQRGEVETILARGDAQVGQLVEQAFLRGETFTAWEGKFQYQVWREIADALHLGLFLRQIPLSATLPWGRVALNYRPEKLLAEYQLFLAGEPSPVCSAERCASCQGCFFPMPAAVAAAVPDEAALPADPLEFEKIRIYYQKKDDYRFFSHLALMQQLERLLRRSRLRFRISQGFHPKLKMTALPPLPVCAEGEAEVVEAFVETGYSAMEILTRLRQTAGDFTFLSVRKCAGTPALNRDLRLVTYEMQIGDDHSFLPAVASELAASERMSAARGTLRLEMDYAAGGLERFARIYRILDPERTKTRLLRRVEVRFASEN